MRSSARGKSVRAWSVERESVKRVTEGNKVNEERYELTRIFTNHEPWQVATTDRHG
jgi:hypothetical protein